MTNEHALPSWIEAVLLGGGDFTTTLADPQGDSIWSRTSAAIDQKIKRVCGSCNNGWMHQLEDACIPLLRPAIRLEGVPFDLSEDDQRKVALWTVKTAYMLEFVHGGEPHVPPAHYHHICTRREPPPGCAVWLAAYAADKALFNLRPKELYVRDASGNGPNGYLSTFSIGHFAAQVVHFGIEDIQPPGSRFLNQVWPVSGIQRWPAANTVCGHIAFTQLSSRFGG